MISTEDNKEEMLSVEQEEREERSSQRSSYSEDRKDLFEQSKNSENHF